MKYLGIVGIVLGVAAHAQTADREKLIGSWTNQSSGESRSVWTLAESGDSMRITQTESDRTVVELACNTLGRECEIKQAGKPVKVSMWFNGPKLVVMEVRGSDVLKRRFQAANDGSTMEMEVIPIVPQGKPEVIRLTRTPASQ